IAIWEALREQLGAQFSPDMAHYLATVYSSRGDVLSGQGDAAPSLEDYGRAIAVWNEAENRMRDNFPPDWRRRRDALMQKLNAIAQ
ncbi:MAG TPA: hypothetical protein PLD03_13090, partial [Thiomonas arsenitoxydans]|nr:hypothetical protein [Thiomonas arsenitoxydans]